MIRVKHNLEAIVHANSLEHPKEHPSFGKGKVLGCGNSRIIDAFSLKSNMLVVPKPYFSTPTLVASHIQALTSPTKHTESGNHFDLKAEEFL